MRVGREETLERCGILAADAGMVKLRMTRCLMVAGVRQPGRTRYCVPRPRHTLGLLRNSSILSMSFLVVWLCGGLTDARQTAGVPASYSAITITHGLPGAHAARPWTGGPPLHRSHVWIADVARDRLVHASGLAGPILCDRIRGAPARLERHLRHTLGPGRGRHLHPVHVQCEHDHGRAHQSDLRRGRVD